MQCTEANSSGRDMHACQGVYSAEMKGPYSALMPSSKWKILEPCSVSKEHTVCRVVSASLFGLSMDWCYCNL